MDSGLDSNPKICAAGRAGREVFLFLLRRNALLEANGEIPTTNVDPVYLSRMLDMPVTEARDAVVTLVTQRLIVTEGEFVRFVGWSEEWHGPKSDADRAAAYRQRKVAKSLEAVVAASRSHEPSVTGRDVKRNVTDLEEKRREKKRREKKLSPEATSFDFADGTGVGIEPVPEQPRGDHATFIADFDALFADHNGGARPTWGSRQGKVVKDILGKHGLPECLRRSANMFRAPPDWPPPPHDLDTLVKHFDKFAQPFKRTGGHFKVTGEETYAGGEVDI